MGQRGQELLAKARLELRNGETNNARRLAEEAAQPPFGAQKEQSRETPRDRSTMKPRASSATAANSSRRSASSSCATSSSSPPGCRSGPGGVAQRTWATPGTSSAWAASPWTT